MASLRPRSKQLLKNVHQASKRNKYAANPIPLAKFNDDMRHAGGPMLAVRFQEDDLTVANRSPSVPFGNAFFHRSFINLPATTGHALRAVGRFARFYCWR
jgi:hypothetical protein